MTTKSKPKYWCINPRNILKICVICLHCEKPLKYLPEDCLELFYQEICNYTSKLRHKNVCTDCFKTLKECYNFGKKCEYAAKLLNEWCDKQGKKREKLNQLHRKLESHNFKDSDSDINTDSDSVITDDEQKHDKINIKMNKVKIPEENETEVKIEPDDEENPLNVDPFESELDERLEELNTVHDRHHKSVKSHENIIEGHENIGDHKVTVKGHENTVEEHKNNVKEHKRVKCDIKLEDKDINNSDIDIKNSDISDDDFASDDADSIEDFKYIKKFKKVIKDKIKQIVDKNLTTRKKPLQNLHEYEKVFDIQLYKDYKEEIDGFGQRRHSEYYLNAKYKCELCYTVYRTEKCLEYHRKWHDPANGDIVCTICSMRFKSPHNLLHHKADTHFGRFACKLCPMVTYRKALMLQHYKKHMGSVFQCKTCSKVFSHQSSMFAHQRKLHGAPHACGICARAFFTELGLRIHCKLQHQGAAAVGEDGVRCEQCNITFINRQVYLIHIKNTTIHKDLADSIVACNYCGLEFDSKYTLRDHKRKVHPDILSKYKSYNKAGPNSIPEGNPDSSRPSKYKKKYLCAQCGREFVALSLLAQHENSHTGNKPYCCKVCSKRFSSKALLVHHEDYHKPPSRKCNICGKKFVSLSNLSNHKRVHIGDRRYKCDICGKGFLYSSALSAHVRGVHLHIRRTRPNRNEATHSRKIKESTYNERDMTMNEGVMNE